MNPTRARMVHKLHVRGSQSQSQAWWPVLSARHNMASAVWGNMYMVRPRRCARLSGLAVSVFVGMAAVCGRPL